MAKTILYAGTYTYDLDTNQKTNSQGIYVYDFDQENGSLELIATVPGKKNPTFLAFGGGFLYSSNEYIGKAHFSSYQIDKKTGIPHFMNDRIVPEGSSTCHIALDQGVKRLFSANYFSGNLVSCAILDDGSLGEPIQIQQHIGLSINKERQSEPHVHSVNIDNQGNYLLATDLGTDSIMIYKIDKTEGKLVVNASQACEAVPPGEGPRHFVFHPNGKHAYLSTELGGHVIVFDYDEGHGTLCRKQMISTLPESYKGYIHVGHIDVSPDGKFVLASNRGHDSIAVYAVSKDGTLKMTDLAGSFGKFPRHFCFNAGGNRLIISNRLSNCISVCNFDRKQGKIGELLWEQKIPSPTFVALRELP